MWTKFIINAAFYYNGKNIGDPKYSITVAIPTFTYSAYSNVTGLYYSLVYAVTALFAGLASDSVPRKYLMIAIVVGYNLTSFCNMIAHSMGMIATMRILLGFFSAFCSPVSYSLIADYFPPEKRTLANACYTAAAFFGIAFANLSNILVGVVGWRLTYFICGVYGLFAVTLFTLFVQEPERGRYDPKKQTVIEASKVA